MLVQSPVVSRLAPTPSGFLHIGNAVNFVLTWLLTRQAGGTLHLRIDDLDRARLRPAYLDNIFRVIDWLGIDYDHGPSGPDDFLRHYSQLLHLPAYNRALRRLALVPGLVQASQRTRTSSQDAPVPLEMPGAAWRAQVPAGTEIGFADGWQGNVDVPLGALMPDFVIRKKDGVAAYQAASIVDDLRLGTNLVVRGLDLLPSTAAQLWLAGQQSETAAFNAARIQFHHHPLLTNEAGQKLSKSQQLPADAGVLAAAAGRRTVFAAVARLLVLPTEAGESLTALQQASSDSPASGSWAGCQPGIQA
ncbi:glutamate--tRNA ligase family protein [Hymenobacter sp. DH14]|uniref:Glutamate--tRNA ligase family protein n=1 Tax=Hymenobacter cyanobacteriorum TaxID=2926463 RepID=A0A9X2AJ39_9BACT|nr:glutamate--tRNA ligase family protein [Hymenobacter cyanobacteriorum]MCI1189370.1 glutamate--tRNA ligase family protein [Hymenobacter cyanobacteriorum]